MKYNNFNKMFNCKKKCSKKVYLLAYVCYVSTINISSELSLFQQQFGVCFLEPLLNWSFRCDRALCSPCSLSPVKLL